MSDFIDPALYQQLNILLDERNFDEAISIVRNSLENPKSLNCPEQLFHCAKLYGFLIDIGCDSGNEILLNEAISFFETNEEHLLKIVSKSSVLYNLANAKSGISEIFQSGNRGVPAIQTVKSILQEPIRLYWQAYKALAQYESSLTFQILINLSNSLVAAGRIVEALQFLDTVLRRDSRFPQALISKADHLLLWSKISNCSPTIALYAQICKDYDDGIGTGLLPRVILDRSRIQRNEALHSALQYGFEIGSLKSDREEVEREHNSHTIYRKYCIDNFLTLNEHSIYCPCVASEKDDIQIGVKNAIFNRAVVPKLELLLNRIKSEFAMARWLYYQSLKEELAIESDARFTELLEGEVINSLSEMRRTSFRLCYGIMDKIALGICKLYGLKSDRIHFETFWNGKERREVFNEARNIHLNALYSISCDLNSDSGELRMFKDWRNKLEHNLLVLKNTSDYSPDLLDVFEDKAYVSVVDVNEFSDKALHLMQLTRAAIFSFVYCVRLETIQAFDEEKGKKAFVIDFKA